MMSTNKLLMLAQGVLFTTLLFASLSHPAHAGGWSLKDRNGTEYTSSGLHGKWVLVNFWAPWCPSCIQEMPEFTALQQRHRDLQVISVAVMYKSRNEVSAIAGKQSLPYPVVFGNEDTAADFGGLGGLPTSFLYAPSGKLVERHEGPLTQEDIEREMRQ